MRVIIADAHEIIRAGLRRILEKQPGIEVVAEAETIQIALASTRAFEADLLILEFNDPAPDAIAKIQAMIAERPKLRIVALFAEPNRRASADCLRAGASAILLKSSASAELLLAVQAVRRGETYLSPRVTNLVVADFLRARNNGGQLSAFVQLTAKQREVLQLLAEGKTNKEVASCLGISIKTVEAHRAQIMEKLSIRTIAGLTKYAIREGLTSVEV